VVHSIVQGARFRDDDTMSDAEGFEGLRNFVDLVFGVCFAYVLGNNVLEFSPVKEEGQRGPAAQRRDDVAWDASQQKLRGTADVEAMAVNA
jgi:hypothetical protein